MLPRRRACHARAGPGGEPNVAALVAPPGHHDVDRRAERHKTLGDAARPRYRKLGALLPLLEDFAKQG